MRPVWIALCFLSLGACGSAPKVVAPPEPPPREFGPEDIGPVPPEQKRVETDAYSVEVEAPPIALVNSKVQAQVIIRAKPGLWISDADEWKVEAGGPSDVDVEAPVRAVTPGPPVRDVATYTVTVVPLRAGVRHITFKLQGTVCDDDFCDVVGDLMSWNLEVR
jgi:hypothetical protein